MASIYVKTLIISSVVLADSKTSTRSDFSLGFEDDWIGFSARGMESCECPLSEAVKKKTMSMENNFSRGEEQIS
ncbi:hypothetical protein F3Y22_tig00110607pilonHSYRG00184 [Hibiscus syriacus]|uniref:Uncharacterized protein n=1 Tax=Hibiscus syriacus TaxID=106335 RepID=A0A6A3A1R7_HIBSY|nr:hypothetical protein F3Y22_tig00110607pilonHSYRG00184 [Hibiscus syriacus]